MVSFDFSFAEPTASYNNSFDTTMDAHLEDIGSIQKSDFVVLHGRPVQVTEITHSKPGKVGRPKVCKKKIFQFSWYYELIFIIRFI